MSDNMTQVIVTAITAVGTITAACFAFLGARNAKRVNDAVNHQHKGSPKLIDHVIATRQTLDEHGERLDRHSEAITQVRNRLEEHDAWERAIKHGEGD